MIVVGEESCNVGRARRELSVVGPPFSADIPIRHWILGQAICWDPGECFALVLIYDKETISPLVFTH